jgi:hypothetical protein
LARWCCQVSTVACLDDGAWLIVHCGQMRNPVRAGGAICDIPFQVKKILDEIEGVTLQVHRNC